MLIFDTKDANKDSTKDSKYYMFLIVPTVRNLGWITERNFEYLLFK